MIKKSYLLQAVVIMLVAVACNQEKASSPATIKTFEDSVSYSYGVQLAESLKQVDENMDVAMVAKGLIEAFDSATQIPLNETNQLIQKKEMSAGNEFLEENKKKEGVQITSSGLQYLVNVEGTGATPSATDKVTVHYTGKLIDGTVFDSSVQRGEPIQFGVNQVIPGWTEGLQLMKEGAKYTLTIPSELGYGARGAGGVIPPNSILVFDVELISVDK
ncbi:MAG: FKBP-type peptidyl-prolyl cis-trans isomerase FkpA [Cyclobacteriaceae bacterium]|jgi:FKBP-type peptidyl-prolyl cis-trans isomerase FkpA